MLPYVLLVLLGIMVLAWFVRGEVTADPLEGLDDDLPAKKAQPCDAASEEKADPEGTAALSGPMS